MRPDHCDIACNRIDPILKWRHMRYEKALTYANDVRIALLLRQCHLR